MVLGTNLRRTNQASDVVTQMGWAAEAVV